MNKGDGAAQINLTPLRLRALRIIQQRPYINAQDLGYDLNERGYDWNHPAQATRFGAKQVTPLIRAGLVVASSRDERGHQVRCGWQTLRLTPAGRDAILNTVSKTLDSAESDEGASHEQP